MLILCGDCCVHSAGRLGTAVHQICHSPPSQRVAGEDQRSTTMVAHVALADRGHHSEWSLRDPLHCDPLWCVLMQFASTLVVLQSLVVP